jgi:hypothetical protein
MAGVFLLVTSPALPWYGELVIVLVALDGRVEWLVAGAGGHLMWAMTELGMPGLEATRVGYGTGALVVLTASAVRLIARRRRAPADLPLTAVSAAVRSLSRPR